MVGVLVVFDDGGGGIVVVVDDGGGGIVVVVVDDDDDGTAPVPLQPVAPLLTATLLIVPFVGGFS